MNQLQTIENQELIQELTKRINDHQLTEQQIKTLQEEINEILEEENWQRDYESAAHDQERQKEAQVWENLESKS